MILDIHVLGCICITKDSIELLPLHRRVRITRQFSNSNRPPVIALCNSIVTTSSRFHQKVRPRINNIDRSIAIECKSSNTFYLQFYPKLCSCTLRIDPAAALTVVSDTLLHFSNTAMVATETTVMSVADPSVVVTGIDFIIHNMDCGSSLTTFRKWFSCDVNELYLKVGDHVRQGLYTIISINASKHSFMIICATSKNQEASRRAGGLVHGLISMLLL